MTTLTRSLTRFRALLRLKKTKADDNIERHEPDRIIPATVDFIFGMVMTAFLMMFTYVLMNGSLAMWIGTFLAHQDNAFGFEDRFAAFTAACIALVNLIVITGVALTRVPNNEDIVETLGDLGDEINERFAEFENRVDEKLTRIESEV